MIPTDSSNASIQEVLFATTQDGLRLPVIDVTLPQFHVATGPEAMAALRRQFVDFDARRRGLPQFVAECLMRMAARRSLLMSALIAPEGHFLDGSSTYVMKLGADNLVPPFDSNVDHEFARSPPATSMRIRLQQVAELLAHALEEPLRDAPGEPLHLINIGGGPAIDSLNALILLRHRDAGLLARTIVVHVLDFDGTGPAFGQRALAALTAPGAALAGVDASLVHTHYDWQATSTLRELASDLAASGALVGASSEGALFEYADDDVVVANLEALRAAGHALKCVVGSATRGDELTRRLLDGGRLRLKPRDALEFRALVGRAGFLIEQIESALTSDQVLLSAAPR